ncbi:MAG TPA: HAMP domain-containing sensor histidine kinase [Polyangiaceae bacterium]|nr:HAMP domain-containing sensor histidine kinase [Polyangiaceae bacterium]
MTPLYAYSLLPVLSVALLLCFSLLVYAGRSMLGLMLYCGTVAVWTGALLLCVFPATAELGERLAPIGAFIVASFAHAAYDLTAQRSYAAVWLAYAAAGVITTVGFFVPGLLYSPATFRAGPAFWPAMGLALVAGSVPLAQLWRAHRRAGAVERRELVILGVSGIIGTLGAWANAVLLTHGWAVPYPMLMVLASVLLVTGLVGRLERASGRRLLERSVLYAALAALLSAGFLFGVMTVMSQSVEPLLRQYRLGALFLLFMAALAVEPLRQHAQRLLGKLLLGGHARSEDLVRELVQQEARADQAARLAELGSFVSAVAHEVRNPLGVIAAHVKLLERGGADSEACAAIRGELRRASTFIEDLLRYGRPRPLELRMIDLAATLRLSHSTAVSGAGIDTSAIEWRGLDALEQTLIEADQAQITQVFVVIFDNAILALQDSERKVCKVSLDKRAEGVKVSVEDSGPGLPSEVRDRVFLPFVTSRKREGARGVGRSGTGLGLAIAKSIVERHQGTIGFDAPSAGLGGAVCSVWLPRVHAIVSSPEPSQPEVQA